MNANIIRRRLPGLVAILILGAALAGFSSAGSSHVTRARLERSLPRTFANLYVQQARILGHTGITVGSLHARAQCDKGGPNTPDRGAGADWLCYMSWTDKHVPLPDGSGKFELNVHSNNCYTAGGPSKLIGLLTITDTRGNEVQNPLHEFDSCFDPQSSDAPTGVTVPRPPVVNPGTPVA